MRPTPSGSTVDIGLNAVVLAVEEDTPRVLVVPDGEGRLALPSGVFDPRVDRTLNLGLRRWIAEQTGLEVGYIEQLYTFGNRYRDQRELDEGVRMLSIGYLCLVRDAETIHATSARWENVYHFFPWEDWREGEPRQLRQRIRPWLERWASHTTSTDTPEARIMRQAMTFGADPAAFDHEKVLQRLELMYQVGLIQEAHRDVRQLPERFAQELFAWDIQQSALESAAQAYGGMPMEMDHRRILASAIERMRGKIKYRPLVFELMPPTFTLSQLQTVVEALSGVPLHKQNFRRLIASERLVEETGQRVAQPRGRPAALYRFRSQVWVERRAPGVGLPKSA
jgi:hypothetical protein